MRIFLFLREVQGVTAGEGHTTPRATDVTPPLVLMRCFEMYRARVVGSQVACVARELAGIFAFSQRDVEGKKRKRYYRARSAADRRKEGNGI